MLQAFALFFKNVVTLKNYLPITIVFQGAVVFDNNIRWAELNKKLHIVCFDNYRFSYIIGLN